VRIKRGPLLVAQRLGFPPLQTGKGGAPAGKNGRSELAESYPIASDDSANDFLDSIRRDLDHWTVLSGYH